MSKYNDEISKIHFSDEGKINLMKNVKENANKSNVIKFSKVSKVSVIAASICLMSVTAFATGILTPVVDVLSPFFGGTTAQTEIIEKIGRPIGASDTDNGITITVEAIMGSKNHFAIIYKLSNEDGSKIVLPEDASQDYLMANGNGTAFMVNGGSTGSMKSVLYDDGYFRLIEARSYDTELPNGKNVTSVFDSLSYIDENGRFKTLLDGNWKLKFEFSYEDMTTEIDVNQTYECDGLVFTVERINISPLAVDIEYTVNAVPEFMNKPVDGEITDNLERELFTSGVKLIITKTDGTTIDMSNSGGGLKNNETYVQGNKGSVFDEIIPLDEILSITIGEIEVPFNCV